MFTHKFTSARLFALILLSMLSIPLGALAANTQQQLSPHLVFEPNLGQFAPGPTFVSHSAEGALFLAPDGVQAYFNGPDGKAQMTMRFANAHRPARISAESPTGGVSNYYRTQDRRNWFEGIPHYSRVRYSQLYKGVDVVFHGSGGHLEYDLEVSPHARVSDVALEFPGQKLEVDQYGTLLVHTDGKVIRFQPARAYQSFGERKVDVPVHFRIIDGHRLLFDVGSYDHNQPLVIDPVVEYTYVIGISNSTDVNAIAVNSAGELIITGRTTAYDYPNTGDPVHADAAFYLTKLNAAGTDIVYSTVLAEGAGKSIALDSAGNAYVAGYATEPGFPLTSQSIATCDSCGTGFAAKFDTLGKLVYSTLLASNNAAAYKIVYAGNGEVIVAGPNGGYLPTVKPYQSCLIDQGSPFLAKLNASGTAYDFATCFGAPSYAGITGLAIDPSGHIYISGSGSVPLVNPLNNDGTIFVSEFSADGQQLLASTYFGTTSNFGTSSVVGLVAGSDGSVYVGGTADTSDFSYTLNSYRLPVDIRTGSEMFVAGFTPGLTGVKFATYIGAGYASAITIDSSDQIYITGRFGAEPIPLKNAVVSNLSMGGFVTALDKTGKMVMSTQFGGRNIAQIPNAIAVDGNSAIYLAGLPDQNTSNEVGDIVDPVNVGTGAAFLREKRVGTYSTFAAKISSSNAPQVSLSYWEPTFVLRDAGSEDLTLSSITWNNGPVNTGDCGTKIPAGTSCIFSIPTMGTAQLIVTSNAQPATQTFIPEMPNGPPFADYDLIPVTLYFPPQQINTTSAPQSFKIVNVTTTAETLSVRSTGDFNQTNDCPGSLNPGASCTVTITYSPTPDQPPSGVYFHYGQSDYIFGAYVGTPSPTAIVLPNTLFELGKITVGKTSPVHTINIHNASATTVPAPVGTISGDSTFSIAGTTCTKALAPHENCAIAVQFTPLSSGRALATLTLTSGTTSVQASLSGLGFGSTVTVSPIQLDFSQVVLGQQSRPLPVTLTNTNANPVAVTSIKLGLPDYSESDTCQTPIPASGSCVITITATPQVLGNRSSAMTVTFDSAAPQQVPLALASVFPITITPTTLLFSRPTIVDSYSDPHSITLSNTLSPDTSYSLTVTGEFIVQNNCPNPLPAHTGCADVLVYAHPLSAGSKGGNLTVSIPGLNAVDVVPLFASAYDVTEDFSRPSRGARNGNSAVVSQLRMPSTPKNALPRNNDLNRPTPAQSSRSNASRTPKAFLSDSIPVFAGEWHNTNRSVILSINNGFATSTGSLSIVDVAGSQSVLQIDDAKVEKNTITFLTTADDGRTTHWILSLDPSGLSGKLVGHVGELELVFQLNKAPSSHPTT